MINAGNFRHLLDRHFHFADVGTTEAFIDSSKIILNGIANVLHRFLLGFSLRPTTGKRGAIHRVTFFRLMKHDLISEAHRRTLYRERHKLQRTLCRPNLLLDVRSCAFGFVCLHIKPQPSDIKHIAASAGFYFLLHTFLAFLIDRRGSKNKGQQRKAAKASLPGGFSNLIF